MAAEYHAPVSEAEIIGSTTIAESIGMILDTIDCVARKNEAMIELYVRPHRIPREIAAHQTGLERLAARVKSLASLDESTLIRVMDQAVVSLAQALLPVVVQLCNAIRGIQHIWINHYQGTLGQQGVYAEQIQALEHKYKQLDNIAAVAAQDPSCRNVESRMPAASSLGASSFCKGAIGYSNGRETGKMAQVMSEDLTVSEKAQVKTHSGAYLWWECGYCAFRLKYYAPSPTQSSIYSTNDFRSCVGDGGSVIEYRQTWLIKCHVYLDKSKIREESSHQDNTGRRRNSATNDRAGIVRISTTTAGSRRNTEYLSNSRRVHGQSITPRRTRFEHGDLDGRAGTHPQYGCILCVVVGAGQGRMNYQDEVELGRHIASKHGQRENLPCGLILDKYQIGVDDKRSQPNRSWDLNIRLAQ